MIGQWSFGGSDVIVTMIFERAYLGFFNFITSVDVMIKGVTPRKYSTIVIINYYHK